MLNPDQIKGKSFQTTGRGSYRAEEVDSFLQEVSASYERMFRENGDLIKKISILAKKVEEYRADEESLKLALLNAQKLADQILAESKEKSAQTIESANNDAKAVLDSAVAEADALTSKAKNEAETIVMNAKDEAEKIVGDATRQSNEILGNINRKVTHESLVYEMIQKEASEFKGKLVAMYREHINLINQLPELVDEQLDKEENSESEKTEEPSVEPVEEPVKESVEESVEESAEETADEVYTEQAVSEEPQIETTESEDFEDISSDGFDKDEVVSVDISEEDEEPAPSQEPEEKPQVKSKPFKLDFSKIDFAEDEEPIQKTAFEVEPMSIDETDAEDNGDDDTHSLSFKNFFKKK